MDEFTWKRKVRIRERRRRQEKSYAFLLIFALIGAAMWYFLYYIHTPEYTIDRLSKALRMNDLKAIEEYVDLPKVLGDAYDELTADLFTYDSNITPSERALFENFYRLVRPQIVEGTTQVLRKKIETDEWIDPSGVELLKGRQLGIDFELMLERSLIRSTKFVKLGEISRDEDDNVSVMFEVLEQVTQTPFVFELALEKTDDGYWKITAIKNYRAYLDAISPKIGKDIADYIDATAVIVADYNYLFYDQQGEFIYLNRSSDGILSPSQKEQIAVYIEDHVIPNRVARQDELDAIPIPPGAMYFANLRKQSTELSIHAWRYYIRGLREESVGAFDTAASLQKRERVLDQRIEELARRSSFAKALPTIQ
ncbi:MAG: DUF2939 domain-containing protein [Selenomonadaceae bacterium]|nr:DUF2939 domain-containing protein [Selenomonadaceae bacterium]